MLYKLILITFLLIIPCFGLQAAIDSDHDGLTDEEEINIYFTDPQLADTDGDGFDDGYEIKNDFSPHQADKKLSEVDSDKDYLNDKWELITGTGLMNPDSDGDLYLDGTEVAAGFDPLNPEFSKLTKEIVVNLKEQSLTYYFDNKAYDSFKISSGIKGMETPTGVFKVIEKYPTKWYKGADYSYPNTKWNLHFTTQAYNFYIHGAYWHNNFGHPMSHGCVNVSYENMENLYWWSQHDTKVTIF